MMKTKLFIKELIIKTGGRQQTSIPRGHGPVPEQNFDGE